MTIGSLAEQAGVRPSAIRYYERLGLLPSPPRRSGRREYDPDAVAQLAVLQVALSTGFTLKEARQLVRGFSTSTPPPARWRHLAAVKARDLEALIAQATAMKALLDRINTNCRCGTLLECGRAFARHRDRWERQDSSITVVRTSRPRRRTPGVTR